MKNDNQNYIGTVETEIDTGASPRASHSPTPPLSLSPAPPFSPPVESSAYRSTGKIARLPADLRDSVNQWITDAVPFDTISERLAALGHPGITHQNISKWKLFGYQKWLYRQEQIDGQRLRYQ